MNNLTRQGVRDLNSLGPKTQKPKKVELPPAIFMCSHRHIETLDNGNDRCKDCGELWTPEYP